MSIPSIALGDRVAKTSTKLAAFFSGKHQPTSQDEDTTEHKVWLLDNVGWHPSQKWWNKLSSKDNSTWMTEYTACFFAQGNADIGDIVGWIADNVGADGDLGPNEEARDRISQRVRPFFDPQHPAQALNIRITKPSGDAIMKSLPATSQRSVNVSRIVLEDLELPPGTVLKTSIESASASPTECQTTLVGPEGWAILSDIDDTVKVSKTLDPLAVIRTTFADIPQPTEGMSALYKTVDDLFKSPAYFYLSASPYNLYPFLHSFIHEHYPPGQIILRDYIPDTKSWFGVAGALKSMTVGVEAYKTQQIRRLHRRFPQRRLICIGDSSQSDPEVYARAYRQFRGWIHAIYIRKVPKTDSSLAEEQNADKRFKKAFKGLPENVWKTFEKPEEIQDHVKNLKAEKRETGKFKEELDDEANSHEATTHAEERHEDSVSDNVPSIVEEVSEGSVSEKAGSVKDGEEKAIENQNDTLEQEDTKSEEKGLQADRKPSNDLPDESGIGLAESPKKSIEKDVYSETKQSPEAPLQRSAESTETEAEVKTEQKAPETPVIRPIQPGQKEVRDETERSSPKTPAIRPTQPAKSPADVQPEQKAAGTPVVQPTEHENKAGEPDLEQRRPQTPVSPPTEYPFEGGSPNTKPETQHVETQSPAMAVETPAEGDKVETEKGTDALAESGPSTHVSDAVPSKDMVQQSTANEQPRKAESEEPEKPESVDETVLSASTPISEGDPSLALERVKSNAEVEPELVAMVATPGPAPGTAAPKRPGAGIGGWLSRGPSLVRRASGAKPR
ncbi:MAG: hypothetical protein Q9227_005690 [Pyrenula ochraceoflavens]